jgi:DNA-binding transcriptional regulator WhiA
MHTINIVDLDKNKLAAKIKTLLNKDIKFKIKGHTVYLMLVFKKQLYFYDVFEINGHYEILNSTSLMDKNDKDAVDRFVEEIVDVITSELYEIK